MSDNIMPDDTQISITLSIREWESIFGALRFKRQGKNLIKVVNWGNGLECLHTALQARKKVKKQISRNIDEWNKYGYAVRTFVNME